MANHNLPTLTSTYSNFVSELDARLDDLAVGMDPAVTTVTNPPANSIRWNSADKKWEKWSGTAWNELSANYAINLQGPSTVSANSTGDALKITQTGSGNAFVVEDSSSPDSTPFVIDGSGTVLIGSQTAIPGNQNRTGNLHIESPAGRQYINRWNSDAEGASIILGKSKTTAIGTHASLVGGDVLGRFEFQGSDGVAFQRGASLEVIADAAPAANSMPGRLVFRTTPVGSVNPTERMRIDCDGNVGIGITPTARLDVRAFTSTDAVRITQTGTGNALVVNDDSPDSTPFVIDQNGKVLIGDTVSRLSSSVATLEMSSAGNFSNGGAPAVALLNYSTNASFTSGFSAYRANGGAVGTPTAVIDGFDLGSFNAFGYDGSGYVQAARILAEVDATPATGSMPGRLVFSTTPSGSGTPVERMRITSGGASVFSGDVRTATVVTQATSPTNSNTSTTATASSLLGGIRTGTPTANISLTLPTGTNMDAAFTSLETNMAFEWSVINLASATHTITVAANTDHTVVGNMVVAANSSGRFLTRKTTTNTFITYRIA